MTNVTTRHVEYDVGSTTLRSFCAWDSSTDQERPGVLIFPEWWGLTPYLESRAQQLAALGYSAMAVDMYGDGHVASDPTGAADAMYAVLGDMATGTARITGAKEALQSQLHTDSTRIAAIGYCFGGALVLHAARSGMDLAGVVSFHGSLKSMHTPDKGSIKSSILVCHGNDDSLVPVDDITAFKQEMTDAGADFEFIGYPGALHGFTNPDATAKGKEYGLPLAYDEATDSQSWQAMRNLFDRVFSG